MSDVPPHNSTSGDLSKRTSDPLRARYMERKPESNYDARLSLGSETHSPSPQRDSLKQRPDEDANQYLRRMMRQQEEKNVPAATERSKGPGTSSNTEALEIDPLADISPVSARRRTPARDDRPRRRRRPEGKTSEATTKAQVLADLNKREAASSKPKESVRSPHPETIQHLRAAPADAIYSISLIDKDVISFMQRFGMHEEAELVRRDAIEQQLKMESTGVTSEERRLNMERAKIIEKWQSDIDYAKEWQLNMEHAEVTLEER